MAAPSDGDVPDLSVSSDSDGGDDTTTAAKAPAEEDERTIKATVKATSRGVTADVAPPARPPAPLPAAGRPAGMLPVSSKKLTQQGLGPVMPSTRPIPSSPVVGPIETLPRLGARDDPMDDGSTGTHTATAPSFVTASSTYIPSLSLPGVIQIREIAGAEEEAELFDETEVRTAVNEELQIPARPPIPAAGAPPPSSAIESSSPLPLPGSGDVPAVEAYDSDDSITTRAPRLEDGWQPETPRRPAAFSPASGAPSTSAGVMVSPMVSPVAMSTAMPSLDTQPAFAPVALPLAAPPGPMPPTTASAGLAASAAPGAAAPKNAFAQTLLSAMGPPAVSIASSGPKPSTSDAYTTEESVTSKAFDVGSLEAAYEDDSVTAMSPLTRASASGRAAAAIGESPADGEAASITTEAPAPVAVVGGKAVRSLVDPADDDSSDDSSNRTQVMRNAPAKQPAGVPLFGAGTGDRARAVRRAPVTLGSAPTASLGSGNALRAEYHAPPETASDSGLRAAPPDPVKADHASIGSIMAMPGYEPPRRSGIGLTSDHASASGQVPVFPGAGAAIVTPMGAPALVPPPAASSQGAARGAQPPRPVNFAATINKKPRYVSVVGIFAIFFAAGMTVFIWHRLQVRAGADAPGNAPAAAAAATSADGEGNAPANGAGSANGEPSARTPAEVSSDRTTWGEPVRPRATATASAPAPAPTSRGRRDRRR